VLEAALLGLLTAGSLWIGAALAVVARPANRWIGLAMAFGSGALIAAVAYELVFEAFEVDPTVASAGFAIGALAFYGGDWAIDRKGGHGRKSAGGQHQLAGRADAIVLGTILDGIPESFVLGASLQEGSGVTVALVVGVFVSNIPESLSATTGLRTAGWGTGRVFGLWSAVVVASVVAAVAGWLLLGTMPTGAGAFALAFAGGALLVMLADTLMPEAYELAGRNAGLLTALGFAFGFALS
jgi:zinc transporter, ZIP family